MERGNVRSSKSRRGGFSENPLKLCPLAAVAVLAGGALGAAVLAVAPIVLPTASGLGAAIGFAIGCFATVHLTVHVLKWVEPICLAKMLYALGVAVLAAVVVVRLWNGLTPLPGMPADSEWGTQIVLAVVLGVPVLPVLPALMAAADRPPPEEPPNPADPARL